LRVDVLNAGNAGIVPDPANTNLPPEAWTDGLNFKMNDGAMESTKGRLEIDNDPTALPYYLQPLDTSTTDHWLYAGYDDVGYGDEIWSIDTAGTHTERTPAAYTGSNSTAWSGTQYGDTPILTNAKHQPVYWDGGAQFLDLPNWPAATTCEIIVSFNGYLVALNLIEAGIPNERLVRWSTVADPGNLPASWDYTDPTVEAGRTELSEDGGAILDAVELNGTLYIYREKATYAMVWVRGTYVFNFRKSFQGWGVIGRHCAKEFAGRHWVFADSDIISHDGTNIKSLVTQKQRDYIFKDIDVTNNENCFVAVNNAENEIWFCYPRLGDSYCTRAFTYNALTGETGLREITDAVHGAGGGRFDQTSSLWDSQVDVWDDAVQLWDYTDSGTSRFRVLTCSPEDKKIYREDFGSTNNGSDIYAWIERENISINNARGSRIAVLGVRPYIDSSGTGNVTVQVANRRTKSSGQVWTTEQSFDPDSDYKISCRKLGRHPGVRFHWRGKGTTRINGYSVDFNNIGVR